MRLAIESLTAATTAYKAAQGSLGVTASSRNVTQAQLTGAGFRSDTIMGTGRYDSRAARKPGMAADRDTTKAASDAKESALESLSPLKYHFDEISHKS